MCATAFIANGIDQSITLTWFPQYIVLTSLFIVALSFHAMTFDMSSMRVRRMGSTRQS